jgi:class 3 adenylate cyclase
VAAYLGGGLEWIENQSLDLRFVYANSTPRSPDIIGIFIDDRSLELAGRWPWPRDEQAALVSIPAELGARALLVDITWSEYENLRVPPPPDADLLVDVNASIADAARAAILPDLELEAAIAAAGNAYLAFDYPQFSLESSDEFRRIVDAILADDEPQARRLADQLDAALRRRWPGAAVHAEQRPLLRACVVAALVRDPALDEAGVAAVLNIDDSAWLERVFQRCLDAALRRRVRAWLADQGAADRSALELMAELHVSLSNKPLSNDTPLRRAAARALRTALGDAATVAQAMPAGREIAAALRPVDDISPVYFPFAEAARRCCFVNFEPDGDGVMRRSALLVEHDGRALPQLAFAVACDALDVSPEGMRAAPGRLLLQPGQGSAPRVVQLDARAATILPWRPERDWLAQFPSVPAHALWTVQRKRQQLDDNRVLVRHMLRNVFADERFAEFAALARAAETADEIESQLRRLPSHERQARADLSSWLADLERQVSEGETTLRAWLSQRSAGAAPATTEAQRETSDLATQALAIVDHARAEESRITDEIDSALARLRGLIAGKYCLLGYTATSLADMTPIPTHPRAPGVMAHANLLNGLLTNRLVHWAPPAANALIAGLAGALATLLSVRLRPRAAGLVVLASVILFVALAGAMAFYLWSYWIALTPFVLAVAGPFLLISIYRYVFIDSERRHLATALGQYTSREIARQVAENPELCRRAESREVTSIFTDLKGFTTISERIGAERTQRVLNVCLGRFTEVMLRHEAMINKFIGDGVFAFWNPVIRPQADHALRACETAVDLQAALGELRAAQRTAGGDEVFDELMLRVGVATGNAVVGPCGSEQKYDYTCIGDSVNVASRLESANKFFGTATLINGATRDQTDGRFCLRWLGAVQVKGKQQGTMVYELIGRAGHVPPHVLRYADDFGRAVALYRERRWEDATAAFESLLRVRPDDLAALHYRELCEQYRRRPPADDWMGVIELQEK